MISFSVNWLIIIHIDPWQTTAYPFFLNTHQDGYLNLRHFFTERRYAFSARPYRI